MAFAGLPPCSAHVVACGYEHATRAAGGIEHDALRGLQDVHDHAHEGLRGEEHAVVACHQRRELVQEVLVDAADDVVAVLVEGLVVEDTQHLAQDIVAELGVGIGKDALQVRVVLGDRGHGIVYGLTDVLVVGQIHQVVVPCLFRKIHCALGSVVSRALRGLTSLDLRALGVDLLVYALEATPCVAQEDEAEYGHAVLLAGKLRVRSQLVRRLPKLRFKFRDVCHA